MRRLLLASTALPLVLTLTPAGGARAAGLEGRLRVTGRAQWDSNAPRDFSTRTSTNDTRDGVFSLLAAGEGRYTAERWQLVGRYDGGVRAYLFYAQESTLVQSAAVEGSRALGESLGVGGEGRAKDRRGGSRTYTDLAASAFLEYAPDVRLSLRLRAGAHRFLYPPDSSVDFSAPELGVFARYRLDRRHALSVAGEYGPRFYGTSARRRPAGGSSGEPSGVSDALSRDTSLLASVGYTYKGPVTLGLTYTYLENASNSYGESLRRHRLSALLGLRLPWALTLLAQGALGTNHYPDGVYLSPEVTLLEEDESQNMLSARLVRPLGATLDLELTSAIYGSSRLPTSGLSYFRAVAGVGLTWRP